MDEQEQGQGVPQNSDAVDAESSTQPDLYSEISTLKAANEQLVAKIDQLTGFIANQQPAQTVNYEELVKTNLPEAIKYAVKETVKLESGELKSQMAKKDYDSKLEREFPQVNSDKQFRDLTLQTMRELVSNGEYHQNSPALAYRAAQLAAGRYKQKTVQQGVGGLTGEAPKSTPSAKTPANSDPAFERWMDVFGGLIKDKDGMRARFEAHKKGAKR